MKAAIPTLLLFLLGAVALSSCGPAAPHRISGVITDPAKQAAAIESEFKALRKLLDTYHERYGTLPERLPDLRDTPDGEPLLDEIPLDPWQVPYLLRRLNQDVVIYTAGGDLIIGSEDDVSMRISFADAASSP